MKIKRIILNLLILVLSVISMINAVSVITTENRGVKADWEEQYSETYKDYVSDTVCYVEQLTEFRGKYRDLNQVVAEHSKLGTVTVKDIIEIYEEDANDEAYDEYSDYPQTRKEMYYEKRDEALNKLEDDPSEENQKIYNFYNMIIEAIDEYSRFMDSTNYVFEGIALEDRENQEELLSEMNGVSDEDFMYYVEYTVGKNKYVLSNVDSEEILNDNNYRDVCELDTARGMFQYRTDTYIDDWEYADLESFTTEDVDFMKSHVIKMIYGIDKRFLSESTFYDLNKKINSAYDSEKEYVQVQKTMYRKIGVVIVCMVVAVILFIALLVMAGHKEKGEVPQMIKPDKLWIDVFIAGFCCVYVILMVFASDVYYFWGVPDEMKSYFITTIGVVLLVGIELIILIGESLARRIKTKSLIRTTLLGKIFLAGKRMITKLEAHLNLSLKVALAGIAAIAWLFIVISLMYSQPDGDVFYFMLLVVLPVIGICYVVWRYFDENEIIRKGADKISEGEINYKISEPMKFTSNKKMKECVNNIGEGLNSAIEDSLKNERLKTELITNVSHDLKTPLTSIINYVDLLKREGVNSENAKKYLDVLDKKSQRLKNLTEDLVEASKLNAGAIKLDKEKIDIIQLLNQSLGEYDEKFQEKQLQIIKNIPEDPAYIMADGRKTWRVFENLYGNIYKYAMPGTRVYIEVKTDSTKVFISIKNISENPLNYSEDELIERFVRGEASRTTEGSGLGLSIARSIVEKQNGEMKLVLDGDLFKVEISMMLICE